VGLEVVGKAVQLVAIAPARFVGTQIRRPICLVRGLALPPAELLVELLLLLLLLLLHPDLLSFVLQCGGIIVGGAAPIVKAGLLSDGSGSSCRRRIG
jgi:hypothetical protein